jgi:NAD(P)-dependent dehydrogenase (short-subunit alcohol dehydrogenase family)
MKEVSLKNRVALVTGSRRGIGRAIALALAGAGADVVVSDVVLEDRLLHGVAEEIKAMGARSTAIRADISDKDQIEAMARETVSLYGRIDILVNCAGVWIPGQTLVECSEENWDRVIDTNLKGTYLCCKTVGKIMMGQNQGNIINLSSQVGLNPGTGVGAYSISKAGIIMLTRQLALELAGFNIRVNALAPGVVKTDFNKALWEDAEAASRIAGAIPAGRMAEPDDIARPALFLASDESAYITGAIINVDGGWQVPARSKE